MDVIIKHKFKKERKMNESTTMKGTTQKNGIFQSGNIEWPVFIVSGGVLLLFVIASLINPEFVSGQVNKYFGLSCKYFGAYWQWLLFLNFLIAMALGFSKYGSVRLGNVDVPELSTFKWVAIIMCTLLAGGGVFWSAAEPMYYFTSTPPVFGGIESATAAAVVPAMEQSFLHWGFLAWSILGTLGAVVLMYVHYHKGHPLQARGLLYPVFGEKIMKNTLGQIVEGCCILAVAAGNHWPHRFSGASGQLCFEPDVRDTRCLRNPAGHHHCPGLRVHHICHHRLTQRHSVPEPGKRVADRGFDGNYFAYRSGWFYY